MVLPASHKVSRVSWYSGAELIIIIFIYGTITPYGPTFQLCSINHDFSLCSVRNPRNKFLVWALSFSLAATKKIDFSFSSSRYLDVSVPWVYLHKAMYSLYDTWGFPCEFPHSEIFGSLTMCVYPKLIAAYRVLHRLLMPRHSPYALCILTFCLLSVTTKPRKFSVFFIYSDIYSKLLPICLFIIIHKEYNSWLCCILYTLIYMQFSKNIFNFTI